METSGLRNNVLHDFTLIKLIFFPFVGIGCFLIMYSDGHTK